MVNQTTIERTELKTCCQCREYADGICQLRARADWGDASHVQPTRKACHFADLLPF
ncbi:MAG: hypothetical protein KME18_09340 [Phormidium tanganyikae FI6-MK23]|nr:hypothetical protein [Phormidium tanganyikae FI6-MK23]